MNKSPRSTGASPLLFAAILLLSGCAASSPSAPPDTNASAPMSLAEMRVAEAGGPSPAPKTAGLVAPVQDPSSVTPSSAALTDAGPNTPLGKQWIFQSIDGYDGGLPGPPTQATFLLSRGNGRMIGNTSCNPMTADFTIDVYGGTLSFRNVTNGSAMCSRQNIDTEDAVVDVLMSVDGFRLDGKTLGLLSKGKVVATLTTP